MCSLKRYSCSEVAIISPHLYNNNLLYYCTIKKWIFQHKSIVWVGINPNKNNCYNLFLAIHIIVPIFLTGRKNDIFLMILFIKMSFFHYNIAKAFFCYIIERHRIWKGWKKYSITNDFEAFIYCDKGIYKSIKILGWNSGQSPMLHPKGAWRIFDKEKSNIFTEDFANGKIDTIIRGGFVPRRSSIMEF